MLTHCMAMHSLTISQESLTLYIGEKSSLVPRLSPLFRRGEGPGEPGNEAREKVLLSVLLLLWCLVDLLRRIMADR